MTWRALLAWGTLVTMGVGAARLGWAEPSLVRSTVGAGGSSASSSGYMELRAVIGQPVTGGSTNGALTLFGGFWFALAPTDCNQDGAANLLDHRTLTQCLTGPGGGAAGAACRCFDVNDSSRVDLRDFSSAQNIFAPG